VETRVPPSILYPRMEILGPPHWCVFHNFCIIFMEFLYRPYFSIQRKVPATLGPRIQDFGIELVYGSLRIQAAMLVLCVCLWVRVSRRKFVKINSDKSLAYHGVYFTWHPAVGCEVHLNLTCLKGSFGSFALIPSRMTNFEFSRVTERLTFLNI
jgi:hypothetical protein